jgi:hypothetical protein
MKYFITTALLIFLASCELGDRITIYGAESSHTKEASLNQSSGGSRYVAVSSALKEAKKDEKSSFEKTMEDGTIIKGTLDKATGEFEIWITNYPKLSTMNSSYQRGTIHFDSQSEVVSGKYEEINTFRDGHTEKYQYMFYKEDTDMHVIGTGENGDILSADIVYGTEATHISYEWQIPEKEFIASEEDHFITGERKIKTSVDHFKTDWSPDEEYDLSFNADGSGHGTGTFHMQKGITETYFYNWEKEGSQQSYYIKEDPSTKVSPDGIGFGEFTWEGAGHAEYEFFYDDGSTLKMEQTFYADGSSDKKYEFDDPATHVNPDEEGTIHYSPDGTGHGSSTVYHDDGRIYQCSFTITSDGTFQDYKCDKR